MSLDVFESAHPAFFDRAACRGAGPDFWYPDEFQPTKAQAANARAVCGICEVCEQCLEFAIDNDELWGIWGGLQRWERLRVAKKRNYERPVRHCSAGHEMTPENTFRYDGTVGCRKCAFIRRKNNQKNRIRVKGISKGERQ